MAPRPWATEDQRKFLEGWMGDYISRQGEGKLHLFWPPLFEAWFSKWPEHATVNLPLPSDPTAPAMTQDELAMLGAAIVTQKNRLENWFRNQRKKIGNANSPAASASGVLLKAMFKQMLPKRRRAHQPIEIFQKRNAELIRVELVKRGYNELSAKSDRMRMRTSVVQILYAAATPEERAAVDEDVEKEKAEIRQEDLDNEALHASAPGKLTPRQLQDNIDVLDQVYTDVHKTTYNATGWVGMTITGGPNPRMGGEFSMKITCFGETPAGNDFEDSCVDFDKNIVEPFEAFLRATYTARERAERALPPRPASAGGPSVTREHGQASSTGRQQSKRQSKKKRKQGKAAVAAGGATQKAPPPAIPSASPEAPSSPPSMPATPPSASDEAPLSPAASSEWMDESFDNYDFSSLFDGPPPSTHAFEDDPFAGATLPQQPTPPPIFYSWPPAMVPPPSPATATAIANAERSMPSSATMVIDPLLLARACSPSPSPSIPLAVARPAPRASYHGAPYAKSGTTNVGGFNFPSSTPSSTSAFKPSVLFQAPAHHTPRFVSNAARTMALVVAGVEAEMRGPQHTGEMLEQAWAEANPNVYQTRAMGPGQPRDTLDDHACFGLAKRAPVVTPAPVLANPVIVPVITPVVNATPTSDSLSSAASKPKAAPVLPESRPHIKPPPAPKAATQGKKVAVASAAKKEALAAAAKKVADAQGAKRGKGRPRKAATIGAGDGEEGEGGEADLGEGEDGEGAAVPAPAPALADTTNDAASKRTRKPARFVDGSKFEPQVKKQRAKKDVPEAAPAAVKRKRGDENVTSKRRKTA
ncbi:hypothetical protein FB451DRAFT_1567149 [Mycena latifolia]|nr:hypothetical protein FB451DRAFT_1567149 [Mycena latifolia]